MKTVYDYEEAITELLDDANNRLSPEQFDKLKESVANILSDYE